MKMTKEVRVMTSPRLGHTIKVKDFDKVKTEEPIRLEFLEEMAVA